VPESNYLEPVRDHLADAGKHLRMALSALDPKGVAAGHDEYAGLGAQAALGAGLDRGGVSRVQAAQRLRQGTV
jgi:hypothetical protein